MKRSRDLFLIKRLCLILIVAFCSISQIQSQSAPTDICEDKDCAPEIFNVQLDEPINPTPAGSFSSGRTDRFKTAYKDFQRISGAYDYDPVWKSNYEASQLGGKSCLRHYQLESQFAHEYSQNKGFKDFIDDNYPSVGFVEKGFESSRKGLNLSKRMENNCNGEAKKSDGTSGLALAEMPKAYQKMGQDLGYFDKEGKTIKPLAIMKTAPKQKVPKLSKKKKIEQMKQQVAALPVGEPMKSKLTNLSDGLSKAKSRASKLGSLLKTLAPVISAFLPPPLAILGKLGKFQDILGNLKKFIPKNPLPGLFSKLKGLFSKGDGLIGKAKELAGKSKDLKDKFKDLTGKADDVTKEITKRTGVIEKLKEKLNDLAKQKDDLTAKLEDKPKKILDQLKAEVGDALKKAEGLQQKAEEEIKLKDKLLEKLDELENEKEALEQKMKDLEKEAEDLNKEGEYFEKEVAAAEQEVEEVKAEEAEEEAKEKMNDQLDELKDEEELKEEIEDCEEDLKELLAKFLPVEEVQTKIKSRWEKIKELPGKLLGKVSKWTGIQEKLKLGKNGIPLIGKALDKVDKLLGKSKAVSSILEILTGKKTKLQERIDGINGKVENVKVLVEDKTNNLDGLKKELADLIEKKTGFKEKLNGKIEDVKKMETAVDEFVKRYTEFGEKPPCLDIEEVEKEIEEVEKEQEEIEPEVEEFEKETEAAEQEEKEIEAETEEVEKELDEEVQKEEELKQEEKELQEEFGSDVKLDPVTPKEWAEEFEVERPYWDAVFHPDDEVVEGYKGRYFQIKLKDAEKNVKLLFGPGEYFMDRKDFRDNYGATIGAFVKETLHSMKKTDQSMVKLFVQGSADIAGASTFRGKLDSKFMYNEVTVLPTKDGSDSFENTPANKKISEKSFTNNELPDLRGNFLREMISIYSKKLQPTLLEGAVTDDKDVADRNAVIYLFIPEELLAKYEE